jgi:hypothetical protein
MLRRSSTLTQSSIDALARGVCQRTRAALHLMSAAGLRGWPGVALLGLIALLGLTPAAHADPITVAFTVFPAPGDPVNVASSTGTFTFDSGLIPLGGGRIDNEAGLGATAVDFSWGTTSWTTATADLRTMIFDESGRLEVWDLGGFPSGIGGIRFAPASEVVDDFYLWASPTFNYFGYTNAGFGGADVLEGRAVWNQVAPAVPEPATLLLFGAGLGGGLAFRRAVGSRR